MFDKNYKKISRRSFSLPTTTAIKGILKFTVSDTGIGIKPQDQEKLFQKFSQLHSSEKKLGTGLGLYITRELCRKMNGDIRVFSKPNHGSTFMICIPTEVEQALDDDLNTLETMPSQQMIRSKNLKALLVDDSDFNIRVLKSYLSTLGVTDVTTAFNGQEAFQQYKDAIEHHQPFDFITMDVDMPIMDGKEATKLIRAYECENKISSSLIVMVSGNCMESEISSCLDKNGEIRADYFLKKPVTSEQLLAPLARRFCHSLNNSMDF